MSVSDAARAGIHTRTLGRAYADGRLTLAEFAAALGVEPSDAVAMLEELGFCRSPDVIRLRDERKAAMLAALRADRLSGRKLGTRLVHRDVIASQRLEGVDARPWFHRI